jgi:hypothetical protein
MSGLAYDAGFAVCSVVPDLGNCFDRQGVSLNGMFMLAITGALLMLPTPSRM